MPSTSYPTPVESLTDNELRVLSSELEEAYRRSGGDDDYWLDDEAESRYWEMQHEEGRRFRMANPDWEPPTTRELTRLLAENVLQAFSQNMEFAQNFLPEFGNKIGSTIQVQRPHRGGPKE